MTPNNTIEEQRERAARWLGEIKTGSDPKGFYSPRFLGRRKLTYWKPPEFDSRTKYFYVGKRLIELDNFKPDQSLDHMAILEDELKKPDKRWMQGEYESKVKDMIITGERAKELPDFPFRYFDLITASPATRFEAFIEVIGNA